MKNQYMKITKPCSAVLAAILEKGSGEVLIASRLPAAPVLPAVERELAVARERRAWIETREALHQLESRYRTMIAAILNLAKTAGWIASVPMLAVRKDKKTKTRDWLTPEQWARLLAELPPHLKPMATFAIESGVSDRFRLSAPKAVSRLSGGV